MLWFFVFVFVFAYVFNEAKFSLVLMINLGYLKIQIFFEIEVKIILTSFDHPLVSLIFLLPKILSESHFLC